MTNPRDSLTFSPPRPRAERLSSGALRLAAPAKINLNLLVDPAGDDGFHDLDSYVAKVTLYDDLVLRLRRDGEITLASTGADCGDNEQNLALRAARTLAQGRNVGGVDIELTKRIPPGGGLGGGSSDAAAVLWGLREVWQLDVSDENLSRKAAELGSDVPLFLGPPAARMTGRGERLAPIDVHPFYALLLLGDLHCSTADVYHAFDAAPPGEAAEQLSPSVLSGPPSAWRGLLHNDLAGPAQNTCPPLADLRRALASATSLPVCITGSGSGMFILCDSPDEAAAAMSASVDPLQVKVVLVQSSPW